VRSRILALLLSLAVFPALAAAAPQKAGGPEQEPRYDPATVINVMAVVLDVRETPPGSALAGVHLMVKADADTFDVYLCPVDFLKEFEVTFQKGDRIQVVGSKVRFGGAPAILAREVRRGETTVYLRGRYGEPNWKPREKPAT
jgi:hypothetical protein